MEAINERHRPDPANMTRGNLPTIDVHAHALLPVWISALAKATGQTAGSVKFADAPLPDWSVEGHLRMMDEHAIGASVLSLPGATSFLRGDDAKVLARAMNEQFAEIIREHPHRFSAFAVVPMDDVEAALEETAYALDVLKLEGVSSDASSDGKYLGHAYYDPWLEELNRRRTTLFVHPGVPPRFEMTDVGLNVSILEFMFESTRMAANMVISGAKERFSKINIISTHGGGTIPYLAARIGLLEPLFGRRALTDAEIQSGLSSFYYDLTASTSPPSLAALKKFISPTRLLMGFDFPMMPTTTIAPAQDQLAANGDFDDEATRAILFGNARKLFPRLGEVFGH